MNEKIVDTTSQRPQKRRVIAELKVMGHFFLLQGLRLLSDDYEQSSSQVSEPVVFPSSDANPKAKKTGGGDVGFVPLAS